MPQPLDTSWEILLSIQICVKVCVYVCVYQLTWRFNASQWSLISLRQFFLLSQKLFQTLKLFHKSPPIQVSSSNLFNENRLGEHSDDHCLNHFKFPPQFYKCIYTYTYHAFSFTTLENEIFFLLFKIAHKYNSSYTFSPAVLLGFINFFPVTIPTATYSILACLLWSLWI